MPIIIPVAGGRYKAPRAEISTLQANMTTNLTISGATDFTVNTTGA